MVVLAERDKEEMEAEIADYQARGGGMPSRRALAVRMRSGSCSLARSLWLLFLLPIIAHGVTPAPLPSGYPPPPPPPLSPLQGDEFDPKGTKIICRSGSPMVRV